MCFAEICPMSIKNIAHLSIITRNDNTNIGDSDRFRTNDGGDVIMVRCGLGQIAGKGTGPKTLLLLA